MPQRITKTVVDRLQPGDKDTFIWDLEIKGFGLRCRPSGGKFYILKARFGHRQIWMTIGRHGSPWTTEAARTEARRLLGMIASGIDPTAAREQAKRAVTVKDLSQRFLDEYVGVHRKPKTQSEYRSIVETWLLPELGHIVIGDLQRADIVKLHHKMRKVPYRANRALAVVSKMMNLAEQWGLRPDNSNPCRHVQKYKETARNRFLNADEALRLGTVLRKIRSENSESPFLIAAIWLLLLTGARRSEILTLKWEYVDLENRVLRLPDSKTGSINIPLNEHAATLLLTIPRMQDNPYVIAGKMEGEHLKELKGAWSRIKQEAKLENFRLHDLRHTFASVAAMMGENLLTIGKLLNHKDPQTTARYAHIDANPMLKTSNSVGDQLVSIFGTSTDNREPNKSKKL